MHFNIEQTTDRQPHTSSGATSSEDEFTPVCEYFGKRQEKIKRINVKLKLPAFGMFQNITKGP